MGVLANRVFAREWRCGHAPTYAWTFTSTPAMRWHLHLISAPASISFCSTASSLSTRSEQSQGGCCEPLTAPLVLVGVCGVLVDPHDLFNMRLLGLTELMAILMTPHFPRRGGLCTGLCGGLTIESALVGYVVCAQCEEFVAMLVAGVGLSPFNPVAMRVFLPVRLGSLWALRAPASGRLCPQRCR